ncbi:hypothetical protein DFH09DRAFT_1309433 [Mycena vulgaris]|nr:hypothetical protein DFH09DRAFT_1309433 [Mycena vulgaris]
MNIDEDPRDLRVGAAPDTRQSRVLQVLNNNNGLMTPPVTQGRPGRANAANGRPRHQCAPRREQIFMALLSYKYSPNDPTQSNNTHIMSSTASLTAIAVLENPRLIPKSKFIVFDTQIYLGSSEPVFIAPLRYFNSDDAEFADISCYSIIIEPARASSTIEIYSQGLTPPDYHVFGDIVWLVPLGSPENFEMCHHAFVHVSGLPTNINKDNSTFKIHAEQYLSATKSPFPGAIPFPRHAALVKV